MSEDISLEPGHIIEVDDNQTELKVSTTPDGLYTGTSFKDQMVLEHLIDGIQFNEEIKPLVEQLASLHGLIVIVTNDIIEF